MPERLALTKERLSSKIRRFTLFGGWYLPENLSVSHLTELCANRMFFAVFARFG
jgi:hypothetical protein